MARGKPPKVAQTGKPPTDSQNLQPKSGQETPEHIGGRSIFDMMEKDQMSTEKPTEETAGTREKRPAKDVSGSTGVRGKRPAEEEAEVIVNIRGKPASERTGKGAGKPPPLTIDEMDARIASGQGRSVVKATEKKYSSKIHSLKEWMKQTYGEEGERPMEELDFRRFLVTGKDGKGITPGSIKVWRAAWGFWQDVDPECDFDFDPVEARKTKRLIKGLRYNAGDGYEPDQADPVDSGRLWKMVDLLISWKKIEYALFFVMVFYGAFRTHKTANLLVKDCRKNTDNGTLVYTDRMKALQAKNMGKTGLKQNYKSMDNLTEFLDLCMDGKGPEDLLFDVNEREANDLMKRVAAAHHWGEGKWVVYSLRHGMSLEAQAVLGEIPGMEDLKEAVEQNNLTKRMHQTHVGSKKTYQNNATRKEKGKIATKRQQVVSSVCLAMKKRKL